ncbi:hypothetical protein BGZ65_010953 [Modicella reniformis]|uniref:FAD-binding domain-containing protein n=1 Tax=Modicella reniformis TaxID=1440133 RepID=A0A9P6J3S1_9FUNG|nr:hypothetical protein BGZ65_010953 [Modicella reniformis]
MPDSGLPIKEPKVLIAGAGIAGLFMAILLDKAGIEYEIFERSGEVRHIGSAIGLGFNVMPVMEQLGLFEELKSISKPIEGTTIFKEDMETIREIRLRDNRALTGYDTLVTSRSQFYALLSSRVPAEKIHMNKEVVALTQNTESVTITCADGSTYSGDILIGADGAYSSVRRALHSQMNEEGVLSKTDEESELISHYMSVMGTTNPLNPRSYEGLDDKESHCDTVISEERGLTWRYFTIPDNRVCWRLDLQMKDMDPKLYEGWLNADYNTFDVNQLPEAWRTHKLPIMGELGDLFDNTPKETISKVVLEEKLFETWKHGRTVLIGDALDAILDAVVLANLVYEIPTAYPKYITKALDEFYLERFPTTKKELNASQQLSTVLAGKTWLDSAARYVLLKLVPRYFKEKSLEYALQYRPQALFLPIVESKGSIQNTPQRPSKKYTTYLKARGAAGDSLIR